jgi:hypothetical protein
MWLFTLGGLGALMVIGGIFGCVVGTPLALAGEMLRGLGKREDYQTRLSPALWTCVGFTTLTVSGFVLLRGLEAWKRTKSTNWVVAAILTCLAALGALGFVFVTCNSN